jgi:hypothetical protein
MLSSFQKLKIERVNFEKKLVRIILHFLSEIAAFVTFVCPLFADELDATAAVLKNDWTYELQTKNEFDDFPVKDFFSNLIAFVKSLNILLACGCIS